MLGKGTSADLFQFYFLLFCMFEVCLRRSWRRKEEAHHDQEFVVKMWRLIIFVVQLWFCFYWTSSLWKTGIEFMNQSIRPYFRTKATIRSSYEGVAKDLAEQGSWAIISKATEKMLSQISCNLLIRRPDLGFRTKYVVHHAGWFFEDLKEKGS